MPIYEYACPDCGHQFELLQKFSDEPARECPACKGQGVKKLVSLSAFQLAGGGWYKDHYGLKAGDKAGGDKAGGDKAGGDKAGGDKATKAEAPKAEAPKAEAKPAAKPAASS